MEKKRIRLEINGVVCGLITQETEEYMQALAAEVGEMMKEIQSASPFIPREAAALTAALSYCDDAKKNGKRAAELSDRVEELEVEAEIWQEDQEKLLQEAKASPQDPETQRRLSLLEEENAGLKAAAQDARELAETISRLAAENASLKETAVENGGTEELQRLKRENEALKSASQAGSEGGAQDMAALEEQLDKLREEKQALEEANLRAELEKTQFRQAAERVAEEARQLKRRAEEQMRQAEERVRLLEEKANGSMAQSGEKQPADPSGMRERTAQSAQKKMRNPLRHEEMEQQGLVSFFEKK